MTDEPSEKLKKARDFMEEIRASRRTNEPQPPAEPTPKIVPMEVKILHYTRNPFGGRYQGNWFGWPIYEDHVAKMLEEGWTLAGQSSGPGNSLIVTFTRPKKR